MTTQLPSSEIVQLVKVIASGPEHSVMLARCPPAKLAEWEKMTSFGFGLVYCTDDSRKLTWTTEVAQEFLSRADVQQLLSKTK